jgi:hypothetical protein
MTGMTDDEVARALAAAVPAMPAPPDRLDRVAARVRRRRAVATAGAVAVVALAGLALAALPWAGATTRPSAAAPGWSPSGGPGDEDPICTPAPPDTEVPASPEAYGCTEGDRLLKRGLAFDFDDAPRQWVGLTCDVVWQSYWSRFGGRAVLNAIERLAGTEPPRTTAGRR